MTELITKVGRYKVRDGGALLPQLPDGTVDLTLAEGLGYERRAAHVVFLEADEVGGAELKFARKALGLRQTELAGLLGVSEFTVSHWEGDHQPIQRTTKLAIAALVEQALQGEPWPPRAWFDALPPKRSRQFEVPLKRTTA